MDIDITSKTTNRATCAQLERLAHDYLGVQQSLDDLSAGCRQGDTFNLPTSIEATDGVYTDTQAAFADQGITVSGTPYQRILDTAVLSVLLSNMDASAISDGKILHAPFAALTSVSSWFQGNTDIVSFKELADSDITSLTTRAFYLCTALAKIDLSGIKTITGAFCKNAFKTLYYPNATAMSDHPIVGSGAVWGLPVVKAFLFAPNVTNVRDTPHYSRNGSTIMNDFGNKVTAFLAGAYYGTAALDILRTTTPPTLTVSASDGVDVFPTKIFVPESSLEDYKSADKWSEYATRIFSIGGSDWQTAMQTLAKEESYTLPATQTWADEYIDYYIYGLEPPTES